MNELTISVQDLITIGAVCSALFAIGKVIKYINKPNKELTERMDRLEKKVEENERKLNNDFYSMEEQQAINMITLRSLHALLSHGLDGNNIDEMKSCKNEIQDRLYTTGGSIR